MSLLKQNRSKKMLVSKSIERYEKALKNYSSLFNKEKQKEKYKLISPLKDAGFTLKEARLLQFNVSKKLWTSCKNYSKRNKGGRPALDKNVIKQINSHVMNNSNVAANRFLKKEKENAFYRNLSYRNLYRTFGQKKQLAFSTFRKNIKNTFKKPHRFLIFVIIVKKEK